MGAANEPVTVTDVVKVNHDMGRIALGAPYRGRDDLNATGTVTVADVSEENRHFGRLSLRNATGCLGSGKGTYCAKPACP